MTLKNRTGTPTEPAVDPREAQVFRLYVTSASPVSSRAIVNARRFLEAHLPNRHTLAVLDIAQHVTSARVDQIIASPTLIRLLPLPHCRMIGDLSDATRLRAALGLRLAAEPGDV